MCESKEDLTANDSPSEAGIYNYEDGFCFHPPKRGEKEAAKDREEEGRERRKRKKRHTCKITNPVLFVLPRKAA